MRRIYVLYVAERILCAIVRYGNLIRNLLGVADDLWDGYSGSLEFGENNLYCVYDDSEKIERGFGQL